MQQNQLVLLEQIKINMKAILKNYLQSPQKVRLVADTIRNRKVIDALEHLSFTKKKAALQVFTLLSSAINNAKEKGIKKEVLFIERIFVNEGIKLKRFRIRSKGRTFPFTRRASTITIELGQKK